MLYSTEKERVVLLLKRFFARFMGVTPFLFVASEVFNFLYPGRALYILVFFIVVVYESAMIRFAGLTYGKFCFGLKVKPASGDFVPLSKSILRAFLVYTIGCGVGYPVFFELLMIFWFFYLLKKDFPLWDVCSRTLVVQEASVRYLHLAALVLINALCLLASFR